MQYLQISIPWTAEICGDRDSKDVGDDRDDRDVGDDRDGRDCCDVTDGKLRLSCEIIRSARKSMSLEIKEDGGLLLRLPYSVTTKRAMDFLTQYEGWIAKHYETVVNKRQSRPDYSEAEINEYKKKLRPVLEYRAAYYAGMMGVNYNRIAIRDQKTRWGSCSGKGNLNFNWKLVLMPPEVLDYVMVHELAHRIEMNHSDRFWAQVERIIPDYRKRRRWLKDYGSQT